MLYALAGAFLVLSPLSLTATAVQEPAKWARLGVTILLVFVGLTRRNRPFGIATSAITSFAVVYILAAVWSDLPHWGIFYKGMFGLTFMSGVMLVYTLTNANQFARGVRFLSMVSAGVAVLTFIFYFRNPSASAEQNRMALLGLNANTVGATSAGLAMLTMYLAFHDKNGRWRSLAMATTLLLGIVILGSGSRGSLLMVLAGSLFIVVPFTRRPGLLAICIVGAGSIGYFTIEVFGFAGAERMISETDSNREGIWGFAWRNFQQSPAIGQGWLHYGKQTANVQSCYLQVLAETGIFGSVILAIALLLTGLQANRARLAIRQCTSVFTPTYLAAGLTFAVLLHGVFESATFSGPSINALLLGIGVAMLDRTPEFATHVQSADLSRHVYTVYRVRTLANATE